LVEGFATGGGGGGGCAARPYESQKECYSVSQSVTVGVLGRVVQLRAPALPARRYSCHHPAAGQHNTRTHARIIAALASRHSISRPAQPNSTENYGRRCLTPLSPHRNLYTITNEQYHFMTSFDRFPVPVRSAVKSNFTHWCCQNLSKGALNALTVQASTTELGKLFQTITMRAEKNVFVSHNEKNDFAIYSVAETLDDKKNNTSIDNFIY